MQVAVLGLGEAGGRLAVDLAAAGCTVRGFDPQRRPAGVENADSGRGAVAEADVVLSVNAAAVALDAALDVAAALGAGTLYADLNTTSPSLKRELAGALPVPFADVALLGVVPSSGLATPALASGTGAERFAELFRPLGMPVDVVGPQAGVEERVRADIAAVIGEPLLERLLSGSRAHAARRVDEMWAAAAYVEELGGHPRVASAAAAWLEQLRDGAASP